MNEQARHNPKDEPIVISKVTMDILLKEPHSSELIALYSFYYYTSKWQDTSQAKATNGYVAKGLGWSIPKVIKFRQVLERLGLIKTIVHLDPKTRVIKGHYIKVIFFWTNPVASELPNELPSVTKSHSVEKANTNASEALILNSSEDNNRITLNTEEKTKPDFNPSSKEKSESGTEVASSAPSKCPSNWTKPFYGLWIRKFGFPPQPWKLKPLKAVCEVYGIETVLKVVKNELDTAQDPLKVGLPGIAERFNVLLAKAGGPVLSKEEEEAKKAAYFAKPNLGILPD